MKRFENKVVIVTGAGGGIGLAISEGLLRAGAEVDFVRSRGSKGRGSRFQRRNRERNGKENYRQRRASKDLRMRRDRFSRGREVRKRYSRGLRRRRRTGERCRRKREKRPCAVVRAVAGDFRQNYQGKSLRQLLFRSPVRKSYDRKRQWRQDSQHYFCRGT